MAHEYEKHLQNESNKNEINADEDLCRGASDAKRKIPAEIQKDAVQKTESEVLIYCRCNKLVFVFVKGKK